MGWLFFGRGASVGQYIVGAVGAVVLATAYLLLEDARFVADSVDARSPNLPWYSLKVRPRVLLAFGAVLILGLALVGVAIWLLDAAKTSH